MAKRLELRRIEPGHRYTPGTDSQDTRCRLPNTSLLMEVRVVIGGETTNRNNTKDNKAL